MIEESVSEYMFLKVVQSRRFRTPILKILSCNAITYFSHPPPRFHEWVECAMVYVFKSSSVQTVPQPNFENVAMQCDSTFFVSTTTFLWVRRVCQGIFLNVLQSRRSRTPFLKMWPCNEIAHVSHPPPRFYEWGECTRVYDFKSSWVSSIVKRLTVHWR